jgi:hypothetical protein
MTMQDCAAVLTGWYAGEIGGMALFAELAQRAAPEARPKWLALESVEAAVAARLAAVLTARRLPIPAIDQAPRRAQVRCDAVAGKSWPETMRWLESLAQSALREMRLGASSLPVELDAVGRMVVRHEIALIAFATLELEGKDAQSLRPIEAFLGELA